MHMQPMVQHIRSVRVFTCSNNCLQINCFCCCSCGHLSSRKTLELSWKFTLHLCSPSCCTVVWTTSPSMIIRLFQVICWVFHCQSHNLELIAWQSRSMESTQAPGLKEQARRQATWTRFFTCRANCRYLIYSEVDFLVFHGTADLWSDLLHQISRWVAGWDPNIDFKKFGNIVAPQGVWLAWLLWNFQHLWAILCCFHFQCGCFCSTDAQVIRVPFTLVDIFWGSIADLNKLGRCKKWCEPPLSP